jgi:hypothetical protein
MHRVNELELSNGNIVLQNKLQEKRFFGKIKHESHEITGLDV